MKSRKENLSWSGLKYVWRLPLQSHTHGSWLWASLRQWDLTRIMKKVSKLRHSWWRWHLTKHTNFVEEVINRCVLCALGAAFNRAVRCLQVVSSASQRGWGFISMPRGSRRTWTTHWCHEEAAAKNWLHFVPSLSEHLCPTKLIN